MNRSLSALFAVVMIVLAGLFSSAPANAVYRNGVVEPGELGLYFNFNFGLPVLDLSYSTPYLPSVTHPFLADNNTRSFWNRDLYNWQVCTGHNYTGACQVIPAGSHGNFSGTFIDSISSARPL